MITNTVVRLVYTCNGTRERNVEKEGGSPSELLSTADNLCRREKWGENGSPG